MHLNEDLYGASPSLNKFALLTPRERRQLIPLTRDDFPNSLILGVPPPSKCTLLRKKREQEKRAVLSIVGNISALDSQAAMVG